MRKPEPRSLRFPDLGMRDDCVVRGKVVLPAKADVYFQVNCGLCWVSKIAEPHETASAIAI
jgi:hypothetical protein